MDTRQKENIFKKDRWEGLKDSFSILYNLPINFLKSVELNFLPAVSSENFIIKKLRKNLLHPLNLDQAESYESTNGSMVRMQNLRLLPPT